MESNSLDHARRWGSPYICTQSCRKTVPTPVARSPTTEACRHCAPGRFLPVIAHLHPRAGERGDRGMERRAGKQGILRLRSRSSSKNCRENTDRRWLPFWSPPSLEVGCHEGLGGVIIQSIYKRPLTSDIKTRCQRCHAAPFQSPARQGIAVAIIRF
jgi:hypothetical protein